MTTKQKSLWGIIVALDIVLLVLIKPVVSGSIPINSFIAGAIAIALTNLVLAILATPMPEKKNNEDSAKQS